MAYVKLAPLALFLLATSIMFSMKKTEAVVCSGICSPYDEPSCESPHECRCLPYGLFVGSCIYPYGLSSSVAKMIDEHPNLCQSDEECMKKGSGNFCARYPNPNIDHGWCFNTDSEELKGFMAMPRAISQ